MVAVATCAPLSAGATPCRRKSKRHYNKSILNMRIKKGFVLRRMCGEHVVTADSLEQINFNKLVTLNESAAYLWQAVEDRDFSPELLAGLLAERYGIDHDRASADAVNICEAWQKAGVTE